MDRQGLVNRGQLFRWGHAIRRYFQHTTRHLTAQARHANHKKFVQIRRKNGQELDPFEEGMVLVEGFLQDAPVKLQPAQFAVNIQR